MGPQDCSTRPACLWAFCVYLVTPKSKTYPHACGIWRLVAVWAGACRQNEDLEQESVAMQGEKDRLQQEADQLAQRLQAVLSEKFVERGSFDAETPIDKTLAYLQSVISVRILLLHNDAPRQLDNSLMLILLGEGGG